jgi:hypothetical protein
LTGEPAEPGEQLLPPRVDDQVLSVCESVSRQCGEEDRSDDFLRSLVLYQDAQSGDFSGLTLCRAQGEEKQEHSGGELFQAITSPASPEGSGLNSDEPSGDASHSITSSA